VEAVRSNWAASAAAHASDDDPAPAAEGGRPVGHLRRPDRAGTWR
jgi:hypothetical protein